MIDTEMMYTFAKLFGLGISSGIIIGGIVWGIKYALTIITKIIKSA